MPIRKAPAQQRLEHLSAQAPMRAVGANPHADFGVAKLDGPFAQVVAAPAEQAFFVGRPDADDKVSAAEPAPGEIAAKFLADFDALGRRRPRHESLEMVVRRVDGLAQSRAITGHIAAKNKARSRAPFRRGLV